jgi:hypothetical protein
MGAVFFCLTWDNTQNCSNSLLNALIQLRGGFARARRAKRVRFSNVFTRSTSINLCLQ